ncbi:MAG: hypothetical protein QM296_11190 [Bacillota bacterium]|nr:hypothetical protein [Bacillota bacterium]
MNGLLLPALQKRTGSKAYGRPGGGWFYEALSTRRSPDLRALDPWKKRVFLPVYSVKKSEDNLLATVFLW